MEGVCFVLGRKMGVLFLELQEGFFEGEFGLSMFWFFFLLEGCWGRGVLGLEKNIFFG